jgi:hypothetical protein
MAIDFSRLALPFAEDEIEWRVQQAGERNGAISNGKEGDNGCS